MRISDFIARTITQRRALVWCGVAVLIIVCIAILVTSLRLDSEIFNVLPGKFPSVQGLKIYDHDFEQTRELTFALVCDPQDVDKLEEFAPVFAERLRGQAWCARVLSGSPMTTADGIRDLQSIAVPLLLNLEPSAFDEAMSILEPDKIRERLRRLRQQIEAGSPRPQFELSFDPLGLIAPALKPFAQSTAIEQEQPLTSPDRTMRIFLVVTNQTSISAFECQHLMRRVNEFRKTAAEGWDRRIASGTANSRDRALGVCIRNFVEHALRCRRDIAWLSRACGHDFFRWVSPMAAFGGHGVLPSSLLPGGAYCGPASFRAAEHDQCRLLRDSRRARR